MRVAPRRGTRVLCARVCATRDRARKGWRNNSSIDPRSLRQLENQRAQKHGSFVLQNRGRQPRSRRWPVDEARPGGQEKSVAMSWFYMAMQREPVVMWSCFIGALGTHPRAFPSSQRRCPYAVQSARGFSPDRVALARFPRRASPGGPPGHLGTNASCARASVD